MDSDFRALQLERLADAALSRARARGATYADFRLERLAGQRLVARDRRVETLAATESIGFSVRVVCKGAWGFAAGIGLTADDAADVAARAIEVASVLAPLNTEPVVLADEPAYIGTYVSQYEIDPFTVPDEEKIDFVLALNDRALKSARVDHVTSRVQLTLEQKFFASLAGSRITQRRVRVAGELTAVRVDRSTGAFERMRTTAPPAGRGWEYLTTMSALTSEADEIPSLLEQKMASPSVKPGRYDLVIHPTNLWLALHESVGHATELDRALGYEANYAGTSFATPDKLDTLRIGSPVMNVTGDRQTPHGLSTVGYDDEGVAAQTWDIIRGGVLVGYQLNRQMAHKQGVGRSNGCAFADAPEHTPLQRMPNVSLQPNDRDTTVEDLIAGVDEGIYIVGDRSWSIDMQRSNFQLTAQRFYRIHHGRIAGQLKNAAYRATTTGFWNAMEAVGGPPTYMLCGLLHCGKGQPVQSAPATHGCPAALFRGIDIVSTAAE